MLGTLALEYYTGVVVQQSHTLLICSVPFNFDGPHRYISLIIFTYPAIFLLSAKYTYVVCTFEIKTMLKKNKCKHDIL